MKKEQIKTAKFGGSSLADAVHFRKVKEIVEADPARRYIVPSAPGRRSPEDEKVTDLLYRCYQEASSGADYHNSMEKIQESDIRILLMSFRLTCLWMHNLKKSRRPFLAVLERNMQLRGESI